MNAKIIAFLRKAVDRKGVSFRDLAAHTGICYQRILHLFIENATISGSELICISRFLEVKQSELMALLDSAA